MTRQGKFISIEGIDGAGKTLQTQKLGKKLSGDGIDVLTTFEPGGGNHGNLFRDMLTGHEYGRWSVETETLLFTAARRNHCDTTIFPALRNGKTVITDRFVDSTRIYQGLYNTDLQKKIDALHKMMIGLEPELTFIIDVPVGLALTRVNQRSGGDERFESYGDKLFELRNSFIFLAQKKPKRCKLIDGNQDIETIAKDIYQHTIRHVNGLSNSS